MLPWPTLFGLCLLRSAPQDLPYSPLLTRNLVLLGLLADVVYLNLLEVPQPWPRLLFSFALGLGVPWLLLQLRRRRERYAQTLAALAGSGLLFTALVLPAALWARQYVGLSDDPAGPGGQQVFATFLMLFLLGWRLAVNGHILCHALDLPRWGGALIVIGWFVLELQLDRALFGAS